MRILFLLLLIIPLSSKAQYGTFLNKQTTGGSEFFVQHRPDLSDSTYHLFLRFNAQARETSANYAFSGIIGILRGLSFTDSCSLFSQSKNFLAFRSKAYTQHKHPYTGDSLVVRKIFKHCYPFPNLIFNSGVNGLYIPSVNIVANWVDTFATQREYIEDTILNLPKCAFVQIINAKTDNVFHFGQIHTNFTNYTDSLYTIANVSAYPYGIDRCATFPILQLNTLIPNSTPYFISQPTAYFYKNTAATYYQLAADAEGDSLVFSNHTLMRFDSVRVNWANIKSKHAPFLPTNYDILFGNVPFDTFSLGIKPFPFECKAGGSTNPATCTSYNLQNPFDTDSTFKIDSTTGTITFTGKSAGQVAALLIKVDEYRNQQWLSSTYRRLNFYIIDSSYYQRPQLWIDTANMTDVAKLKDYEFVTCPNSSVSIPFTVNATNLASYHIVSDNAATAIPGSGITYNTNNTNTAIEGVFNWNTTLADTGWHYIHIKVDDSACAITPFIYNHEYFFKIFVTPNKMKAFTDTTICLGKSIVLNTNGVWGTNLLWTGINGSLNTGLNCTTCATPTATPFFSTAYMVQPAFGTFPSCAVKDTVQVNVVQPFDIAVPDSIVCGPRSFIKIKAKAVGNNTSLSYQWLPASILKYPSTKDTATLKPGTYNYTVIATDSLGCFADTVIAKVVYDSAYINDATASKFKICPEDTITLTSSSPYISWSPNYNISTLSGSPVQAWPSISTNYTATLNSPWSGCKGEKIIEIETKYVLSNLIEDTTIYDGDAIYLVEPNTYCGPGCEIYWWNSFEDLKAFGNYKNILNPQYYPHETTVYALSLVQDGGACASRDTMTVHVICEKLYIPNAFNPLSDIAENRTFGARNTGVLYDEFCIYNRWGQCVFTSKKGYERWDGTYQGKPQPTGVYIWMAKGKCRNGTPFDTKGNFMLFR
jgi:hypothetical protein